MHPKHSKHLLLGPLQKAALYFGTLLLWVSGGIWLLLAEGSTARSLCMKIHGAAAMAFLMVFGTLLLHHVPLGWKQDRQRPSGVPLLALCSLLVLTGWGLYYIGNESARQWTSRIHWIIGLIFPFLILVHVALGRADKQPGN